MELHILGSSSSGNCYIFESQDEALIVECGVRFSDAKKKLDYNKFVGCLVTHEHQDHSKYIKEVCAAGIDVYTSLGTLRATGLHHHRLNRIQHGRTFEVGKFKIKPFDIKHDAAEPLGFLIFHPEMGNTLFLTDSFYVEYKFPGLNNILVEANYSEEILDVRLYDGNINPMVADRVRTSHMSIETLKDLLLSNDLTKVNNIVLLHLSDENSDAKAFQKDIAYQTGKYVTIADKKMKIALNLNPF